VDSLNTTVDLNPYYTFIQNPYAPLLVTVTGYLRVGDTTAAIKIKITFKDSLQQVTTPLHHTCTLLL